ncbi:EipB family protein [Pseudoroseomonas globiformis]|uniref:EipB family protein n=1 Tax=Teichococcus globiformis TaxID=2307229 RepID=A0ABV7G7K2_9PROT
MRQRLPAVTVLARRLAVAGLLATLATPAVHPAAAATASSPAVAPHRAAYVLKLDRIRQGGEVMGAEGAMAFEVMDACDGWTTRQRLQLTVADRSGSLIETASEYSTWESKDGKRLRFTLTQSAQGAVTQRVSGEAELKSEADGGSVRYEMPAQTEVALPPGTLLPMAHTIRTLELARAGKKMLVSPLFDGTSEDGAQDSTTVLGGWTPGKAEARFPLMVNEGSAKMRIAFFGKDAASAAGVSAPEYEVGLRYYANGVADEMNMDFGDFAVNGVMEKLERLPGGC